MLTDVFFRRYQDRPMFDDVGSKESALFVQAYKIIDQQIWQYWGADQKVVPYVKKIWTDIHDRLAMEIGVTELSPLYYSLQNGNSGWYSRNIVMQSWLNTPFKPYHDADIFVKRRLSFIELAFRIREEQVASENATLSIRILTASIREQKFTNPAEPGSLSERIQSENNNLNKTFKQNVDELNERFKQAGMPLHYHNSYLQITQDELINSQVEQPFWALVKDPAWKNVSIDMAEALDRRDTGGRDPSFYAAKALESTIKVICDQKFWTTGNESGVAAYLNHLESKSNGPFIEPWERQAIQRFYSDVRNDLGHGPGSKAMPFLTGNQIDQTIEFCMSWVKSLINRL
jgi:hypothetical protein